MRKKLDVYAAVVVGVLGLAAPTAFVSAAQDQPTAGQMKELAAAPSTPAEHSSLRQHLLDMAASLSADADAHATIAAGYRRKPGNSNRATDEDLAGHCDRIAQRAREAATTARELASYHGRLAGGVPKSELKVPANRVPLPMADVQVQELIVNAGTPAEHLKVSKQFAAEAARYTAEANRRAAMAPGYRSNATRPDENPGIYNARFVQQMRSAADAAQALAAYHARLATETAKGPSFDHGEPPRHSGEGRTRAQHRDK